MKINIPSYFCIIFMFHSSDYLSCCAWVQLGGNCRDSWIFHLMIDSHAIHQRLCERYLSFEMATKEQPRGVQRKKRFHSLLQFKLIVFSTPTHHAPNTPILHTLHSDFYLFLLLCVSPSRAHYYNFNSHRIWGRKCSSPSSVLSPFRYKFPKTMPSIQIVFFPEPVAVWVSGTNIWMT